MRTPTLLAALAVVPAISAQVTSSNSVQLAITSLPTRVSTVFSTETNLPCSTLKGPSPFVIFGITTSFTFTYTITQNDTLPPSTYHSAKTTTITRDSTYVTSLVTTTQTITSTNTIQLPTVTVLPGPNFVPLQNTIAPTPTAVARIKRAQLEGQSMPFDLFKRESTTSQIGWEADPNTGRRVPINETMYTLAVFCPNLVTRSIEYYITDPDVTSYQPAVGTAVATTTVTTTTTTNVTVPASTYYAACQSNNVVNHIDYDSNGRRMYFDAVYFQRSSANNSDINEVGVDATSPVDCCGKCQSALEGCSEAFYVPAEKKCQMRLRRAILAVPTNATSPATGTATGALATSTGVDINAVCPLGSRQEYVGDIRGREDVNPDFAWYFMNGDCGHLSVNTMPRTLGNGTNSSSSAALPSATGTPGKRSIQLLS